MQQALRWRIACYSPSLPAAVIAMAAPRQPVECRLTAGGVRNNSFCRELKAVRVRAQPAALCAEFTRHPDEMCLILRYRRNGFAPG